MADKAATELYLPDTMANWPWPRAINPLYEQVKAESNAWLESLKPFNLRSQHAFNKCDFSLLASLAYPSVSKEHLRTGCDLMNMFFVIDEYTDVEPEHVVRGMVNVVIDALNNPHKPRPEGEVILGTIAQQFWKLAMKTASPSAQRHMIESFTDYLESVVLQAGDRDNKNIRSIDSYLQTRRENIGARPSYVPLELGFDLPDDVFYHPLIQELSYYIADLLVVDNDIVSYNKEQATGDDRHNIITIAMHQFNTDLDGAMRWAASYHTEIEKKFMDGLKRVPSWGPIIDPQIQQYIYGLAHWPRANDCWSFESARYFGSKGLDIQKTRLVPLLPKLISSDGSLHKGDVIIPLVDALSNVAGPRPIHVVQV